jgi:hypothetical protein
MLAQGKGFEHPHLAQAGQAFVAFAALKGSGLCFSASHILNSAGQGKVSLLFSCFLIGALGL